MSELDLPAHVDGAHQYVVLQQTADGAWQEIAEIKTHNATAAIKRAAEHIDAKDLEDGVVLRAVSARAWQAGRSHVKAEQQTRIVTS